MTNNLMNMILFFSVGLALGIFFFGGLWITVKKTFTVKIPGLWIFGSFMIRISIVMLGFYYIAPSGWLTLILALFGFVIARFGVIYLTKILEAKPRKRNIYYEA